MNPKKTDAVIIATVFCILIFGFAENGFALEDAVGSGTTPVSSAKSGLIKSQNPLDSTINDVITGNVAGGKHFRGIVPYKSASDFGTNTSASSLDSFMRYSAPTGTIAAYTGKYQPYHSPATTVTKAMPGAQSQFVKPTESQYVFSAQPKYQPPIRAYQTRPMTIDTKELEKLLFSEIKKYSKVNAVEAEKQNQLAKNEDGQQEKEIKDKWAVEEAKEEAYSIEQIRQAKQDRENDDAGNEILSGNEDQLPLYSRDKLDEMMLQKAIEKTVNQQQNQGQYPCVYEQMKAQIEKYNQEPTALGMLRENVKDSDNLKRRKRQPKEDELAKDESEKVRIKYRSFALEANDKFNQSIKLAENYVKQGKYYRAADAYSVALAYKPDDPLAYAGKSHALFAAGEYVSSALFLSRAIEIFPEYAGLEIDLPAMLGDRDRLESRVVDVERWVEKSDAAELRFLLGYIYFRADRPESAKQVINAAYKQMPESTAVKVLKEAIEVEVESISF